MKRYERHDGIIVVIAVLSIIGCAASLIMAAIAFVSGLLS